MVIFQLVTNQRLSKILDFMWSSSSLIVNKILELPEGKQIEKNNWILKDKKH